VCDESIKKIAGITQKANTLGTSHVSHSDTAGKKELSRSMSYSLATEEYTI
jgi:hypothetical protein